jgi:hypothetical protein
MNTSRNVAASWRNDISLFIGTFATGLGVIVLLKLISAPPLVSTLLVAAIVVGYGVMVTRVPRMRFRLDQAGDNAYYLGLLFTLISMAWALYGVSRGVASSSANPESYSAAERIIGDFGIALASTITGILVRIVLHQMRVDPADIEHASRLELAMAAERLVEKLKEITGRMGEFYEQTRQQSEDSTKALFEDYRNMSGQICGQLEALSSGFTETLAASQVSITDAIGEAATQIQSLTTSFQEATERLKSVEPPPTLMNDRLRKIVASLDGTGTLLTQATGHLAVVNDQLALSAATIAQSTAGISAQTAQRHEQDADSAQRSAAMVQGLEERLSALNELSARHAAVVHGLEINSIASADAVKQAQGASTEVLLALTGVTEQLRKTLDEARQPTENIE